MPFFIIIIITVSIWVYLRRFENSNIYFPSYIIESTPEDKKLAFEDIFYQTEDDRRIHSWFIPVEEARGTVLFCHGNGGNISHRLDFIEIFHKLKLNVFIFDYRGYGKSRGRPSEKGFYLDTKGAYDYLISRPEVDKNKIIIYGESLGGAAAIDLARRVKASHLIVFGTFTSTVDIGKKLYPHLPVRLIITQRYDSFSKIRDISIPKLIIHSRDDEIVPFSQAEKLYNKALPPKEFFEMNGEHNQAALLNKEKFSQKIIDFLLK